MKYINYIEKAMCIVLLVLCAALIFKLYKVKDTMPKLSELAETAASAAGEEKLPALYDLREYGKAPTVKNQGRLGTCWAVAASSALESIVLPEKQEIFSADHMSLQNGFGIQQKDGGDYTMIMAYLAGWRGPVWESDDPYGDGISRVGLMPRCHVQEMQLLKDKDYEAIKRTVYQYGAVQSTIYMDMENAFSSSVYYDQLHSSYCYNGDKAPNHDILIIGWNDYYSSDNFTTAPSRNGAFICQNSWGEDFSDGGVFYVSYDDINIGKDAFAITSIEDTDNYDAMIQTDICGWVGQLGYGDDLCYMANRFTSAQDSMIEAVGFYTTGKDTRYEITVMDGDQELSDTLLEESDAEGRIAQPGYYTVKLDEPVRAEAGKDFYVVIKLNTSTGGYPAATEYPADEATRMAVISDGNGYISHNGVIWTDTEDEYGCNVCMKIYLSRQGAAGE